MKAKENVKAKGNVKNDKFNKLERALAEKQLSSAEYNMWKKVYLIEAEQSQEEKVPVARNKRRR